jgi:uncharacterized protein with ATP-grasp and redox domains
MLIRTDCIPCILRMTVSALRKLFPDEAGAKPIFSEILEIPALRGRCWDMTSPEVLEHVMNRIIPAVNDPDPFRREKARQNKMVSELYPFLADLVRGDSNPLYAAVKLAILGNSIDLMMADDAQEIRPFITEHFDISLSREKYGVFVERLASSRRILYFGDNAGEILFDRLLIETIKKGYDPEVVFVVKSKPALNDATPEDARSVGMDEVAVIMENGIEGPLPGTILRRCSDDINQLVRESDMIVSKGGGNFDTLDEEGEDIRRKITFMLLSKCHPYQEYFGVDLYDPVLDNFL